MSFVQPETPEEAEQQAEDESSGKDSAATELVKIAERMYEFGVSDTGETFAVSRNGPKIVRTLRGGKASLRAQLSRTYFLGRGKVPAQQALADALLVMEGISQDTEEQTLHLRVARHDGALWLDLGDATGRSVKITGQTWTVEDEPPVLFKRTGLNSALPVPVPGHMDELWKWLNVATEDRPLVVAWLVAAMLPDIPHPVLGLWGEQGTGKSTAEKVLVSLVDPSPVPLRKAPRDADSWVTAAAGSWVVGLDNLSGVPDWLSDSMCRAVTGDGDVRRKLYTDGELSVFAFRRCLIVNGIDVGALRGDLAERMLPIELETIAEENRIDEESLWPRWKQVHPRLLGALLAVVAGVAGVLPSVRLGKSPRMADFGKVLAAVDQVMGTSGLERYLTKQGDMARESLTGDPFVTAMQTALADTFTGTAGALLTKVTPSDEKWRPPKGWPHTARQVTTLLKRQAPPMRKAGWDVHNDDGENHDKTLRWTIAPPRPERARNGHPQDPQDPQTGADQQEQHEGGAGDAAGTAGVAGNDTRSAGDRHPRDPQLFTDVNAGQSANAGDAGVAGMDCGPSQDAAKSRCASCFEPTLDWVLAQRGGRCISCSRAAS